MLWDDDDDDVGSVMSIDSGITDLSEGRSVLSDTFSLKSNQENIPVQLNKRKRSLSPDEALTPSKKKRTDEVKEQKKAPTTPSRRLSLMNAKSQPATPEHKRVLRLRTMEFNTDSSGKVTKSEHTEQPQESARTPRRTK